MDTSETYIMMRRAAIPDLGMGIPPVFSLGAEVQWITTFVCTDIAGNFYYFSKDEQFQLERQDQLQEIIGYPDYINLLTEFIEDIAAHKTMEQFWLCLLMNHKYGKDWDGENWIE